MYNSQLKDPIDIKVTAYSYLDLTIGTLAQLKKEWGELLLSKEWLLGFLLKKQDVSPGSISTNARPLIKLQGANCFWGKFIERAGLTLSNNKLISPTGYEVEINLEDETGKLPLCGEFYNSRAQAAQSLKSIYTETIINVLNGDSWLDAITVNKEVNSISNNVTKNTISNSIAKILEMDNPTSPNAKAKNRITSVRHFAKLLQAEIPTCNFFDENGKETGHFRVLTEYFTVIPSFEQNGNFKINILTANEKLRKSLMASPDPSTANIISNPKWYSENDQSSDPNNPLISVLKNARKKPKPYSEYMRLLRAEFDKEKITCKNFIDFKPTCMKITIKVFGPENDGDSKNEFTLVALVAVSQGNKSGRFGTFNILTIKEI
jgi:hypothetical protein